MRTISLDALKTLLAANTDTVWLTLLTISSPSFSTIRLCNNTENIISRGEVYLAHPFTVVLPQEREEELPSVRVILDNIDQTIITELRQLLDKPTIVVEVVTSIDFDIVEVGPFNFNLPSISYDALTITGELSYEPILTEPYPSKVFNPSRFPGMF